MNTAVHQSSTDLEQEIACLVRKADSPLSQRERELYAARVFRLISQRRPDAIRRLDADCASGGQRAQGRPENNELRITIQGVMWERLEHHYRLERGLVFLAASNGRATAKGFTSSRHGHRRAA